MDNKILDDLSRVISDAIPESVKQLGEDTEKQGRAIAHSVMQRMDLVLREEFDTQTKVLAKTRKMVSDLEQRVKTLEQQLLDK